MSYFSDVDIIFYAPSYSETPYALIKLWFDENYPHRMATKEWMAVINYMPEVRGVRISYCAARWNGGYEHPNEVEKVLVDVDKLLDNQDINPDPGPHTAPFDIAYEFNRTGEEANDNEMRMSTNAEHVS